MDDFSFNDNEDPEADRVILNVGGIRFETYITTLQNIPDTRLAWLTEGVEGEPLGKHEFFFDRHPDVFVHILNFYRTGKLHTPSDMCGPAFEEELQFWGIDEKQMEPCCWQWYTKHREADENLKTFEGPGFEDLNLVQKRKCSNFGQDHNNCCFGERISDLWDILNYPNSSKLAMRFSLLSCAMIVTSLSVYCLMTMKDLKNNESLNWINRICLVFFTIEFVTRIVICPSKIAFGKDYRNWIDFLSIIPSFLMIPFADRKWIRTLVIIRLLRVFKFFKLSYGLQVLLHTLKASSYELFLLLLILLIPLVVFSSLVYAIEDALTADSSHENRFDSIPRTFWWCIITMTTVGYGDLTPKTWIGQIVGSICAIVGVLIIALPISVIGNNFTLYYAHARARLRLPKKNKTLLQGRLRGLLRQPAMLSSRDRDRKSLKKNDGSSTLSTGGRLTVESSLYYLQLRRQYLNDQVTATHQSDTTLSLIDADRHSTLSYEKQQQTTDSSINESDEEKIIQSNNNDDNKNTITTASNNNISINSNNNKSSCERLKEHPAHHNLTPSSNISLPLEMPPSPVACLPSEIRNGLHTAKEALGYHINWESMQRGSHYPDLAPVSPRPRSRTVDSTNGLFLLGQSRLKQER